MKQLIFYWKYKLFKKKYQTKEEEEYLSIKTRLKKLTILNPFDEKSI